MRSRYRRDNARRVRRLDVTIWPDDDKIYAHTHIDKQGRQLEEPLVLPAWARWLIPRLLVLAVTWRNP